MSAVHLRGLSTAVPPTILPQPRCDVFRAQPGLNRLAQRIIGTSFDVSGIERRYTVLEELTFDDRGDDPIFFDRTTGELMLPGTKPGTRSTPSRRPSSRGGPARDRGDARRRRRRHHPRRHRLVHGLLRARPRLHARARPRPRRPCSATTWASWAATRRCRRCATPCSSARPTPTPSCWWSASSSARCTCARRTTPTRSSRRRSSPTVRAPGS